MQPALYLIPCTLGETDVNNVLPSYNREVILSLKHFIVENERTARRFLKKVDPAIVIDDLSFVELNKHTPAEVISGYLAPMDKGESIGIISEAGCPAVADPGADVVAIAQKRHLKVIPLVGPSSIILSVMASGFNGQSFAFHGYLPIEQGQRTQMIKKLENRIYTENETQLFIETPYRNNKLVEELIHTCRPSTRLCIASNITCSDEYIRTLGIKDWSGKVPDLSKKPTIFLIYK
jgi:16S rRNA (cytidine1402-2'-O)-methyltransferase